MEDKTGKLIKVTFEYEKEIHVMENPLVVQDWESRLNGALQFMSNRITGNPMDSFNHETAWKKTIKP